MRIMVLVQFFPPEIGGAPLRNIGHVSQWAKAGHDVTVVTHVPNSPYGKIYKGYKNKFCQEEQMEGVTVRRMLTLTSGKHQNKWRRGISFVFNLFLSIVGGLKGRRPDIIIASAPYLTGVPGMISAFLRRVPFVYEMQDPWVQVIAENKVIGSKGLVYKLLSRLERFIISRAKLVVVIGEEMASFVKEVYKLKQNPVAVPNAANLDLDRKVSSTHPINENSPPKTGDKFVIGIIGNMGSWYDFEVILAAAESLKDEACYFMFVGEGKQKSKIKNEIEKKELTNVGVFDAVPMDEVGQWIRACHVTVVSLKSNPIFRLYMPIRTMDSLLLWVPVFFGGTGEVKQILEKSNGGRVFKSGDKDELVELIETTMKHSEQLEAMGKCGAEFIRDNYTQVKTAKRFLNYLEAVLNR